MINSESDNSMRPLPKNRKGLFFEIIYAQSAALFKISLLITLFLLPLLAWMTVMSISDELLLIELEGAPSDMQSDILIKIFNKKLYGNLASIPLFAFLFMGLGGISFVMRNLVWNELTFIWEDFKKGFKDNWRHSLMLGLLFGLIINSLNMMNWILFGMKGGISGIVIYLFFLLIFISMFMFCMTQQVVYKNDFMHLIRNSMIMTFSRLISNLFVLILTFSPFILLIFYSVSLPSLIVLIAMALSGFGYMALILTLYSHSVFDKYINAQHYPQLVNKGIGRN